MKKNFEVAGKDRAILFSGNAIRDYESMTNANMVGDLAELLKAFEGLKTLNGFSKMLYCGLKWGLYEPKLGIEPTPELTLPQVTDWCDDPGSDTVKPDILKHLLNSLSIRYNLTFTETKQEEKKSSSPEPTSGSPSISNATS